MNSIIQTALLLGLALPGFSQAPPAAPAPPAPVVAPVPPAPPASSDVMVAPEPPEPPMPPELLDLDLNFNFDFGDMEALQPNIAAQMDRARDKMNDLRDKLDLAIKPEIAGQMDMAREKMRELQDKLDLVTRPEVEAQVELARENMEMVKDQLFLAQNMANPKPRPFVAPDVKFHFERDRGRRDSDEGMYRRGAEYLDQRQWDKAIEAFDQVIERKGNKADGAYYWKGYALSKQGQSTQALATLSELYKAYPSSRWLNDAKALEVEVRQSKGQAVSPEGENDEDLKLLAINGLVGNDPDRVVPLLDKILQNRNSPKVKERALFVLAQSKTPQAREIVVRFAKGSGNPDLQTKAVEYLGIFGGKDSLQILSDVYGSTNDLALRRSILHSFLRAGDKDRLVSAAKNEQNPELRIEAIRLLGSMGAQNELNQLYSTESSPEAKGAILDGLYSSGNVDKLIEIARSEKDPKLRTQAIHRLAGSHRPKSLEALVAMYPSETDKQIKMQILHSFMSQGAAKEVVDVARREKDPELQREAVRMLTSMKSKEATDYLTELLSK